MSHHVEAKITIGLQSFNLHYASRELATVMGIPVNATKVYKDISARAALSAMRSCSGDIGVNLVNSIDALACHQGDIQGDRPEWCIIELSHYG